MKQLKKIMGSQMLDSYYDLRSCSCGSCNCDCTRSSKMSYEYVTDVLSGYFTTYGQMTGG